MNEPKKCKYCGKLIERRKKESARDYRKRQFCNRKHSSLFQHSGSKVVNDAAEKVESNDSTEKERKTALEVLSEAANNETLDWITRINAAGKLAPYESRKPGATGKKQEKSAAAEKAASGNRFAPGVPPKVLQGGRGK